MKRLFLGTILALAAAAAVSGQTVSGSVAAVKRGGTSAGTIVLDIPDGYHVNSDRPNTKNLIPTVVSIRAAGGRIFGLKYPKGRNKIFAFSEEPLSIYEGKVTFGFKLSIPRGFRGSVVKLRVEVEIQPCTDEVCYPPRTERITITARVR